MERHREHRKPMRVKRKVNEDIKIQQIGFSVSCQTTKSLKNIDALKYLGKL